MSVWLITGGTGYVGRHVLEALQGEQQTNDHDANRVIVLGRQRPSGWPAERFVAADLTDTEAVHAAIADVEPDIVIHTAGRTPPAPDEDLYRANFWATIHLLGALRRSRRRLRVVLSGSAAEFGPVDQAKLPVHESFPCNPTSAYGRSKWLATQAGLSERSPLEVVVARVFNPIGPGAPVTQAFGRFAYLLGERAPDPLELRVGDLDARRDFIDVRDVARAMIALALRGRPGLVYNVGTGQSRRVGDGLDHLIRSSGRRVTVRTDPAFERTRGPVDSRADTERVKTQTGWEPVVSWEQSLDDLWHEVEARTRVLHTGRGAAA